MFWNNTTTEYFENKIVLFSSVLSSPRFSFSGAFFFSLFAIISLIIPSLLYTPIIVHAAPNYEINYQGKLTDNTGATVSDADYDMEFKLYTALTGGAAIWTETLNGSNQVSVTSGLFSVMLGSTTALSGVDFNQTLYLGVNIANDGEMSPRKILGAVPAAFEAKNANTVGGVASTSFIRSDQVDTISASSASTLLTVTQNGAGDILNLFDGGTEVFTVLDGGNVGIGEVSPSEKLDVVGNIETTGYLSLTSGYTAYNSVSTNSLIYNSQGTGAYPFGEAGNLILQSRATGAARDIVFATGVGGATRMIVDRNGNVGIATTSPWKTLSVAGDLSVTGGFFDSVNNSAGTSGYVLQTTGTGTEWVATSSLGFGTGDGSVTSVALSAPTGFSVSGSPITTSGTLALSYTAGYEGLLTASSSNWNTFYNTPSNIITDGTGLTWTGNTLSADLGTAIEKGELANSGTLSFDWVDAEIADILTISSGGTIDPQAITLATGNVLIGDASNNAIATSSLFVAADGNVGIGTTSPTQALDVVGNIQLSNDLYVTYDSFGIVHKDVSTRNLHYVLSTSGPVLEGYGSFSNNISLSAATTIGLTVQADGDVEFMNGNVGIGDTTPSSLLNIGAGNRSTVDGLNDLYVTDDIEVDGALYIEGALGSATSTFTGAVQIGAGNGNNFLTVGSGDNNSRYPFAIEGYQSDGPLYTQARIDAGSTNGLLAGAVTFVSDDFNVAGIGYQGVDDVGTAGRMSFSTLQGGTFTETMRLDENGNVGIGDTTPSSLLNIGAGNRSTVDGLNDLYVTDDIEVDGDVYIAGALDIIGNITNAGWAGDVIGDAYIADDIAIDAFGSVNSLALTDGGTIGFDWVDAEIADILTISSGGTIDPQAITLATGNVLIGDASNNAIATSSLFVAADGNVGIGTTTPQQTLSVVGDFSVTGTTTFNNIAYNWPSADGISNQVLQTNGSGTLSWGTVSSGASDPIVPAFSVHMNGTNDTVTLNTFTKLDWQTEDFDTNSDFNLTTERFTPTVAGKYLFTTNITCDDNTTFCLVSLYKNGVAEKTSFNRAALAETAQVTAIIDMNGTTDYIEVFVQNSGGTTVRGDSTQTFFTGARIDGSASNFAFDNDNIYYATGTVAVGTTTITDTNFTTWGSGTNDIFAAVQSDGTDALLVTDTGNTLLAADAYLNFGATEGTSGYGIRDNSGTVEYKASGGDWAAIGSGGGASDPIVPAFSVHMNGTNDTVTNGVATKLDWQTETYDTNSDFDITTNERFTPTVAGKYLITLQVNCFDNTAYCEAEIWKNGTTFAIDFARSTVNIASNVTTIVDMNGTTDYIEAYVVNGGGTLVRGLSQYTFFTGARIDGSASNFAFDNDNIYYATGTVAVGTTTITDTNFTTWGSGANDIFAAVQSDGTDALIVDQNGNVAIGTSTAGGALTVLNTTEQLRLNYDAANYTSFTVNSSGNLTVAPTGNATIFQNAVDATTGFQVLDADGGTPIFNVDTTNERVAIGTSSPLATLDVYGDAILSGTDRYFNFGATAGSSGYGFRDSGGTIQYKNSGGSWTDFAATTTDSAFSVHKNGTNQTVTATVYTKLTWSTEDFDTNSDFDLTTERFTPTVAGKYLITGNARCTVTTACSVSIYKNGSEIHRGSVSALSVASAQSGVVTAVVDFNGTTDYVELYVYNGSGTVIDGAPILTHFSGALIGGAGAGGADLAEIYPTVDSLIGPGDVLAIDSDNYGFVKRATGDSAERIIGIVSTQPGLLLNDYTNTGSTKVEVALAGRVPLKVTTEGGEIIVGDTLTAASSTPGVARKALPGEQIIGYALEPYTGTGEGTITVFVQTQNGYENTPQAQSLYAQLKIDPETGNIGIGTTTPTYPLHVIGDIAATAFVNTSSRELKTDIEYLEDEDEADILTTIRDNVDIAQYHYKAEDGGNKLRLGLIAEEAPSEVLSVEGDGVDIYQLATFALAGVKAVDMNVQDIDLRVQHLEGLFGTASSTAGTTVWDKVVALVDGFVDGVLQITGLQTEQIDTALLCIGTTCVDENTLKALLLDASIGSAGNSGENTDDSSGGGSSNSGSGNTNTTNSTTTDNGTATSTDNGAATSTNNGTENTGGGGTSTSTDSVTVSDTTAPVITIIGDASVTLEVGNTHTDGGAVANDDVDGDITANIVTNNQVDTNVAGTYAVTYTVTDVAGNQTSEARTVTVTDPVQPDPVPEPEVQV